MLQGMILWLAHRKDVKECVKAIINMQILVE